MAKVADVCGPLHSIHDISFFRVPIGGNVVYKIRLRQPGKACCIDLQV